VFVEDKTLKNQCYYEIPEVTYSVEVKTMQSLKRILTLLLITGASLLSLASTSQK